MIDPITKLILEGNLDKLKEDALDHILEGYDLNCQACGRVIKIVKDGQGPLSCCNQRMFITGSNPVDPTQDIEEAIESDTDSMKSMTIFDEVRKSLKGVKIQPDFMVPVSDVNFSPDNQVKAQKKADQNKVKQEKTPAFKESKLLQSLEVFDECDADFTPYNQPEVQKKTEEERKKWDVIRGSSKVSEGGVKDIITKKLNPIYQARAAELAKQRKMGLPGRREFDKDITRQNKEYELKGAQKVLQTKQRRVMADYKRGAGFLPKGDPLYKRSLKKKIEKRKAMKVMQKPGYRAPVVPKTNESKLVKDMEVFQEKGFETKPKGWTDDSVKKYGKSLVKGGGTKEGFFEKCVNKMKDKMDNPEGFCASIKDEAHDSTYWRGKGKSPQEVGKDVKKHKNV